MAGHAYALTNALRALGFRPLEPKNLRKSEKHKLKTKQWARLNVLFVSAFQDCFLFRLNTYVFGNFDTLYNLSSLALDNNACS